MRKRVISKIFAMFVVFIAFFAQNSVQISAVMEGTEVTTVPETVVPTENAFTDEQLEDFVEPEYVSQFTFPDYMKAVTLRPSIDFAKEIITQTEDGVIIKSEPTSEQISTELDEIMTNVSALGMNSVIIFTSYDGKAYYSDDINDTVDVTPVEMAISKAKENGLFVYLVFDINFVLTSLENKSLQERI